MRVVRLVLSAMLLVFVLSACNLGSSVSETEEPLPTEFPDEPAGKPEVTIISPSENSEFTVDQQVLVSVSAIDTIGVTRVQLFANGSIVKTISSEEAAGNRSLSAVLDYTPRAPGQVQLQVLAFRGTTASDPEEIFITVRESQQQIIATTAPQPGLPQIPNDGVCRALTNVGLNFRREPTTTNNNVITTLPSGTLAPILARLPDNTWWKISYGSNVGWVSAPFVTLYGNCTGVPIEQPLVTPTPAPTLTFTPAPPTATPTSAVTLAPSLTPTSRRPDLIVTSIGGSLDVTIPSGQTSVTETYAVTVTNAGPGAAGPFVSILTMDDTEYDLGVVSGLSSGQSIALTIDLTFTASGSYDIRVDVDSDNQVEEVSNVNNRGDITVDVSGG